MKGWRNKELKEKKSNKTETKAPQARGRLKMKLMFKISLKLE